MRAPPGVVWAARNLTPPKTLCVCVYICVTIPVCWGIVRLDRLENPLIIPHLLLLAYNVCC